MSKKRSTVGRLCQVFGILLLAATCAQAEIQHVIAISVDGLRGDLLQRLVTFAPEEFPNFKRLREAGASTFNARCDYAYSETVPNHITMITGRPVLQPAGLPALWHHGFISNFPTATDTIHASGNMAVQYKASVFDVIHDHGLSTALYLGKTRLEILARSYNATNGAPDVTGDDNGRAKIDFVQMQDGATETLVSTLVSHIAGELETFTLLHVTDPDTAGHEYGWTDAEGPYRESVRAVDSYLGSIFAALDARPALHGRVALVLTADHGGGGGGINVHTVATLPQNYTVPFFVVAPGVQAGSDIRSLLENRTDPGNTRPDYTDSRQPVRNGDMANVCVALLGLPAIPGALIQPEFTRSLAVKRVNGKLTVQWPRYLSGWTLQGCSNLSADEWVSIEEGIAEGEDEFSYTVDATDPRGFFRLHGPESE